MSPSIKRVLQTQAEKFYAAPTPFRKRIHSHFSRSHRAPKVSPFVTCPDNGYAYKGSPHEPHKMFPYQFRPVEHRFHEKLAMQKDMIRRAKIQHDRDQINEMLPIDVLIRALQEQADKMQKPPDPIPIRLKVSPQMRRLKIKKTSKKHRHEKLRKPERGQFIAPVYKPVVIADADPKLVAFWMIACLLDLPAPLAIHTTPADIIEHRRARLYQEEGAKWVRLFCPGANETDPNIPKVFRMFDNTDEGIPEEFFGRREENQSALKTYQFRVIAKRFLISQEIDFEERFYLGEIIGMSEDEVKVAFLKLNLEQAISGKSEADLRNLVFTTYKDSFSPEQLQGEDLAVMEKNYEDLVVPLLDDLFSD
ncbi:hypothetical protein L3Y34_008868 [Caenorhabditis briggsae]|uniref:Uncharacterized protein n=1 Tax=Caenorhabditis briggsae TaxID=6238 RepID=A0AAE9A113_CAEBR|nr:hypothetical protein L3Y34_008868 [Caenorhabditis briggsae]